MPSVHDDEGLQMSDRSATLVRQIGEAFGDVAYPGDSCLTEGCSSEAVDIADFLKGRRWQDLRLDELVRNHESLFFMTPEAIRYYLPAFLVASILHYRDANPIPSTLVFLLRVPKDAEDRSRFQTRFRSLATSQRGAIKAFLEYLRDEHAEDFLQANEVSELLSWWNRSSREDVA
jgi:hypothetical protein